MNFVNILVTILQKRYASWLERHLSSRFRPLPAPFPLSGSSLCAPLMLHCILGRPLTAPLHSIRIQAAALRFRFAHMLCSCEWETHSCRYKTFRTDWQWYWDDAVKFTRRQHPAVPYGTSCARLTRWCYSWPHLSVCSDNGMNVGQRVWAL